MTSPGLLSLHGRRHTCLPELIRHFGSDTSALLAFCKAFAGTRLLIPGPELFRQLEADARAAAEVHADPSPTGRLRTCRANKTTYVQLREIYAAVHGRRLTPPDLKPEERLSQAIELLRANRHSEQDIADIFGLTPVERARVRRAATAKNP